MKENQIRAEEIIKDGKMMGMSSYMTQILKEQTEKVFIIDPKGEIKFHNLDR